MTEAAEAFALHKFTPTAGATLTSDSMYWRTYALSAAFFTVSFSFYLISFATACDTALLNFFDMTTTGVII